MMLFPWGPCQGGLAPALVGDRADDGAGMDRSTRARRPVGSLAELAIRLHRGGCLFRGRSPLADRPSARLATSVPSHSNPGGASRLAASSPGPFRESHPNVGRAGPPAPIK